MTKTKQATLFSLKSWKNVAADSIQKYKDILANHNETESEILKALVSLKKKNPSKDVILSAKIDLSLELLERHQNPRVCHEAQMLRNYWKLNKNCTPKIIVIDEEEPPTKKRRTLPETEICEIKTTKQQTIEFKVQAISHPLEKQLPNEAFLMNAKESVPLAAIKPTKLVSKSQSVNRATYNNVMRQLCDAVKLFTQELGEQEVRLYLEKKSHINPKVSTSHENQEKVTKSENSQEKVAKSENGHESQDKVMKLKSSQEKVTASEKKIRRSGRKITRLVQ